MRAKLDENMPNEAIELLVAAGWTCDTARDEGLGGADDTVVGEACRVEARVLFTLDLDFADIRGSFSYWLTCFQCWPASGPSISSGSWSQAEFGFGVSTGLRSDRPLQPTSGASRTSCFQAMVRAARG